MKPGKASSNKSVSIRTVSDALGMNASTVSRILNHKPGHSYAEETVKRVHEKAKQLGYRPNRLVQGVIEGKSMTIGVVMRLGPFYSQVIEGAHDLLAAHGYLPVIGCSKIDLGKGPVPDEKAIFSALLDHRVDGIIFRTVNEETTGEYFQEACDRGIPMVAVDRELANIGIDFVTSDDQAGGTLAARHLLDFGHRVIAIPEDAQRISTFGIRLEAFAACVRETGGAVQPVAFNSVDAISKAMTRGSDRPTAFFAANDRYLRNVYVAAQACGRRIPEDLSVVGYGDLIESQTLIPEATTIDQQAGAVGARAAELLLARIADHDKPLERVLMPVRLLKRGSTGMYTATPKKRKG